MSTHTSIKESTLVGNMNKQTICSITRRITIEKANASSYATCHVYIKCQIANMAIRGQ